MTTVEQRSMSGWIAWYETEKYDSQSTEIEDLPEDGLVGLLVFYSDGRSICHSGPDLYFFEDDAQELWSTYGTIPELKARYPAATKIIRGKWVDCSRFASVVRQMETLRVSKRPY